MIEEGEWMGIVVGAFVPEQRSHFLIVVEQLQSQVDHFISIAIQTNFVSFFCLRNYPVVFTKNNVCLVEASIEFIKGYITTYCFSISVQFNFWGGASDS